MSYYTTIQVSSTRYRPDLDGLRAVAVLAVILFHAKVPGFTRGYHGVDVFFVLSGFFITRLIAQDLEAGVFSFTDFYARRARRILPALFAVVFLSSLAGVFFLLPEHLSALGTCALYTTACASNVFFWRTSHDYFAAAGIYPLLHTWSLGVEEQFYMAAPLALCLLHRLAPRRLKAFAVGGALISFALALWNPLQDRTSVFYLTPTRAWEFLLGSLVVLGAFPVPRTAWTQHAVSLVGISLVGVGLAGWPAFPTEAAPGALLADAGTMLVILAGEGGLPAASRILSLPPLVSIGKVSYSLYLWHWPVMVFVPLVLARKATSWEAASIAATASAAAFLSHRFIETPFRENRFAMTNRLTLTASGGAGVLLLALGLLLRVGDGLPDRHSASFQRSIGGPQVPLDKCGTMTEERLKKGDFCRLGGLPAVEPRIMLWGDSHAGALVGVFDDIATETKVQGFRSAIGGCAPLLGRDDGARTTVPGLGPTCEAINRSVLAFILRRGIKDVVLVARWNSDKVNRGGLVKPLGETVKTLAGHGVRVWVVEQVPEIAILPAYVALRTAGWGTPGVEVAIPRAQHERNQERSKSAFAELRRTVTFRLIDPTDFYCDSARCVFSGDGRLFYRDTNHVNPAGAARLRPAVERIFEEGRRTSR